MNRIKKISLILIMMFAFLITGINSYGAEMDYSVKANIPENQIDKNQTYFDLKMKPGQSQEISLTVFNSSDKKINLHIIPNVATTNQNGVIDFSETDRSIDSSLKYPITKLITGEQEVTLEGNEQKVVSFKIQMPEEELKGKLLGGFYIYKDEKKETNEASSGVQITNKYAMILGLQITENDQSVTPELTLNKIAPDLINYRTAVTANIQNTQPTYVSELSVIANVTKKGSKEVLYSTKEENMAMAPNSNFDFPISWNNQPLKAGNYTLDLKIASKQGEWSFKKDFKINTDEVKSLNKEAVDLPKEKEYNLVIIGICVSVVTLLVGIFIVLRIREKQKIERLKSLKKKKRKKKKADN